MHTEATLEITRNQSGRLDAVKVVMPIWQKETDNGAKRVDMPFFGVKFNVFGKMDLDQTCNDAVKAFCVLCERSGKGLETELLSMGWQRASDNVLVFQLPKTNFIFEQIVTTGDSLPTFVSFTEASTEAELICN